MLEWEWQPKTCWPGGNCVWVNDIDGYYVYETDPLNNTQKYMKEVIPPEAKVVALPLPWGYHCYGVKAYVEGPEYGGQIVSEMANYCPNQPLQPEKLVLTPTDWLTTGGQWIQSGDCDMYGTGDTYANANKNNGFGNNIGEALVGSYFVDDEEQDCYREGNYSAGVKFAQPVLPPGAVLQKAILKFSTMFMDYGATGLAAPSPSSCVAGVGKAKKDWSVLNADNHFAGNNSALSAPANNAPIASLSLFASLQVDVTSAMNEWLKNVQTNHGFILIPVSFLIRWRMAMAHVFPE